MWNGITDVTIAYVIFLTSALGALWALVELIIGAFDGSDDEAS